MQKSNIEYLTHHWGFYTGCNHWKTGVCAVGENCWAKSLATRFHRSFEPTLHPEKLLDPLKLKKPARIGVCFTGDLFGDWVDPSTLIDVSQRPLFGINQKHGKNWELSVIVSDIMFCCPQHQFFFLTKAPGNIAKWGKFPDNAWVGASVCNQRNFNEALQVFLSVDAKHKWLSIEPLMGEIKIGNLRGVDWVVIGGWSNKNAKNQPKLEWIKELVEACDTAKIPVFLKNNLRDLFRFSDSTHWWATGVSLK